MGKELKQSLQGLFLLVVVCLAMGALFMTGVR